MDIMALLKQNVNRNPEIFSGFFGFFVIFLAGAQPHFVSFR